MAYSPSEKYPGAVDTDPNYQGGKFRDNNPSTTNNGSPLKAIDRNELLARDEAIMNDAGFEYSGVADTPQDSQLFKAYKASLGNGANLLSNHNFLIASPDDSQPAPSATPTSYPPGFQIFSGVFANETTGITNLTYVDGRVSFSGGDFYMPVANAGAIARLNSDQLVASVADFDGKPRTRGVSFALVGSEYRITVGVDALEDVSANPTPLGSVKFEQGSAATGHGVDSDKSAIDGQSLSITSNIIRLDDREFKILGAEITSGTLDSRDLTQPYSCVISGVTRYLYDTSFGIETFDFRAIGPSDGDDVSDSVDVFFTEVHSKRYSKALMSGRYLISRNFDINGRYPNQDTTTNIEFSVRLDTTHTDKTREVFSIENTREYAWSGFFQLFCGLPDYSTRRNFRGLKFNLNCSYMSLGSFLVYGTCHDGVWIGNSTQLDWKQLLTRYCGTGNALPTSVEANITSAVNSGAANSVAQRCTLTVDNYLDTLQIGDYVSLIVPGSSGYSEGNSVKLVTGVNPGSNEITVFPWVTVAQQSNTLRYASGAGLREIGNDSNVHNFGYLDALACGVGFNSSSLYGGMKSSYASQFSTIGYVTAKGISDFHQATSMGTSYWEGNGWEIIKPTTSNQSVEILNSTNLDLDKCMALSYYAGTTAAPTNENRSFSLLRGISININGNKYSANVNPALNASNSLNLYGNSTPTFNVRQAISQITVNLMDFESISRLFNMNFSLMHLSGRGANGQPTSAVTFVPSASYSINGGAAGANFQLSGFTSASLVAVEVDESDTPNSWRITRYQGS